MTPPPQGARRPHRKTRAGCVTCKRRKIKCDEGRPICSNCVRFKVPCGYLKPGEPLLLHMPPDSHNAEGSEASSAPRKKPGRPRRIWTIESVAEETAAALREWQRPFGADDHDGKVADLNLDNIKLLLHFTTHTGPSLAAHVDPASTELRDFWTQNAPKIALSATYIFHLMFSLAARHMLFLGTNSQSPDDRQRLVCLAEQHMVAGITGMTQPLSALNEKNCGLLYLASLLVCFCALAAGPSGPSDLLACSAMDLDSKPCIPLIRGVRLIRQAFPTEVVLSGLMAPLDRRENTPTPGWLPRWVEMGRQPLKWVVALDRLKTLVSSHHDDDCSSRLRCFHVLEKIYEATYGRDNSTQPSQVDPRFRFVMGWLYMMDDEFTAMLQHKDPVCLVILAHFAPLLREHQEDWFLDGWMEQLIFGTRALLPGAYTAWMQWPLEAAGFASSCAAKDAQPLLGEQLPDAC